MTFYREPVVGVNWWANLGEWTSEPQTETLFGVGFGDESHRYVRQVFE